MFSRNGQTLASGSKDNTIRLWDANTGNPLRTFNGHAGDVVGVAFSPDGQKIASASHDNTIRLWDANTGNPLRTFSGHTGWVWSVAFSPDGQKIASASHDETARLWETDTGDPLQTLSGHTGFVMSIAFSPDGGHWLAEVQTTQSSCGSWDLLLYLTAQRKQRLPLLPPTAQSLRFSPPQWHPLLLGNK